MSEPFSEIPELARADEAVRDGIGEEDNPVPLWFNVGFYGLIVAIMISLQTGIMGGEVNCTPLIGLALLYLLSILRQGPRGFMAQVHSPFQDEDEHCHDDHCH